MNPQTLCDAAIAAGHDCMINVRIGPVNPEHGSMIAVVIAIAIIAFTVAVAWSVRNA